MKTLVCLLATLSLVASFPQAPQDAPVDQVPSEVQAATPVQKDASAAAAAPAAPAAPVNPYGPRFFGPGINNPLAIAPHPGLISIANQVIQSQPNLRVRIMNNGQVEITDEFGIRKRVVDAFGNDPLETFDPEEVLEREQERRELEFEQQQRQAKLRRQQQLLQFQIDQLSPLAGNAPNTPAATAPAANRFFLA